MSLSEQVDRPLEAVLLCPDSKASLWTRRVEATLPLALMGADTESLARLLAAHLACHCRSAAEVIDAAPVNDKAIVRDGVSQIERLANSVAGRGNGGDDQALFAELRDQAAAAIDDARQLSKAIQRGIGGLDARDAEIARRALKSIAIGLGQGDKMALDDAEDGLATLSEVFDDGRPPVLTFLTGWLKWRHRVRLDEAQTCLFEAALATRPQKDALWLACVRHLAVVKSDHEDAVAAYSAVAPALDQDRGDVLSEALVYAFAGQRVEVGRKLLPRIAGCGSLALIPCIEYAGTAAIDDVVETCRQRRRESIGAAQAALANWGKALRLSRRLERATSIRVAVPGELIDGAADLSKKLGELDLFSASLAASHAEDSARLVNDICRETVNDLLRSRQEDVDRARSELAFVQSQLDGAIGVAKETRRLAIEEAHAALRATGLQQDNLQTGCLFGVGLGVTIFAAYIVVTFLMARSVGVDTTVSRIILFASFVPVGIGVICQLIYGAKQAVIEAEVAAKVRAVDEQFNLQVLHLKQTVGSRIPSLREHLAGAEASLGNLQRTLTELTTDHAA
jgi:hypothetical protein